MMSTILRKCRPAVGGFALFAAASIGACSSPSAVDLPKGYIGSIVGSVRDSTGKTISGAAVSTVLLSLDDTGADARGRCDGGVLQVPRTAGSDAGGHFSVSFHGGFPFFTCVFVDASASVGGRKLTGTAEVDSVTFGPGHLDSVVVVITLK